MKKDSLDFLENLVQAPSPSGFEDPARKIFRDRVGPFSADVVEDSLGNVIASRNPGGRPRVMLAAHSDEIGFVVTWINPEGFVYFQATGFATYRMEGRRVVIRGLEGPVPGVISRKTPSGPATESPEKASVSDFWVDIGASSRAEAEKAVRPGNAGTYEGLFERLPFGNRALSRAFDDKAGVFVIAETLRLLAEGPPHGAAVFAVATAQEEIGSRASGPCAFGLRPDIALVVDVHKCTDYPGGDPRSGEIRLGAGGIITRGANVHPLIGERLAQTALSRGLPFQVRGFAGPTPTDARNIQVAREGIRTGMVGIPLRYMHSAGEMLSLDDLESISRLLTEFIRETDS